MKVAAVHFDAVFADIKENYKKVEAYISKAKEQKAEYLALPEFFTTGFATSGKLLECIAMKEDSSKKMIAWAVNYQMHIGGSYLFFDGRKVQNVYCLACPDGKAFFHSKDVPTAFEGLYYETGDQNKVVSSKNCSIGLCMCWEMMRYNTIRQMQGKVNFVMAGSCWWDLWEGNLPESLMSLREFSRQEAVNSPVRLAKTLQVPVIQASHKGRFEGEGIADSSKKIARDIVGATQIIDKNGNVLAKKEWTQEPGVIYADIKVDMKSVMCDLPDQYWISLPQEFTPYWNQINERCNSFYKEKTLPYCIAHSKL